MWAAQLPKNELTEGRIKNKRLAAALDETYGKSLVGLSVFNPNDFPKTVPVRQRHRRVASDDERQPTMTDDLLSANEAARRLGITTATLYDWLAQSDVGTLIIRGQPVTINYFQGGAKGQGRIKLEVGEIERLEEF